MEKILEKARELGKLIADSEIYINSKEKEALFLQDEEASTLMYEYTKTQENLSKEFQKPNITKEEIEDIKFKSTKAFEKLCENKIIKEHLEASRSLASLVEQVNMVIGHFVRGDKKSSCSGNCSSCSSNCSNQ